MLGKAGSVTKARCYDEGRGGRSVIGMHGSVTGKEWKCNCGHGNVMSRHKSVTVAWLSSWFTRLYSWA